MLCSPAQNRTGDRGARVVSSPLIPALLPHRSTRAPLALAGGEEGSPNHCWYAYRLQTTRLSTRRGCIDFGGVAISPSRVGEDHL